MLESSHLFFEFPRDDIKKQTATLSSRSQHSVAIYYYIFRINLKQYTHGRLSFVEMDGTIWFVLNSLNGLIPTSLL